VVDWVGAHPNPTKEEIESLPYKKVNSNVTIHHNQPLRGRPW
jgi:hypothetical protein